MSDSVCQPSSRTSSSFSSSSPTSIPTSRSSERRVSALNQCEKNWCTHTCPADVYHWEGDHIVVSYENCIECGACRMICPYDNICCVMPRGGFGVQYKYG